MVYYFFGLPEYKPRQKVSEDKNLGLRGNEPWRLLCLKTNQGLWFGYFTFLKLVCSDLTYKEIDNRLNIGTRAVDGYRDALFTKLQVRSRVGLALFAIKHNLVVL